MSSRNNHEWIDNRTFGISSRYEHAPTAPTYPSRGPTLHLPRALWKAKWWLLLATAFGTFGGFARVVLTAPTYSATSVVELIGVNESFMGMNQFDQQAGTGSYSSTAANIQTQTRLLMGSPMLGRVVERVTLEMTPVSSIPQDVYSKLRLRLGVINQDPATITKQALQEAASSTRARGVGASRLLELTCESSSPEVAATFVNTLAAEHVSQTTQSRSSSAMRTMQWLEGQIEEARTRIEQAEQKVQDFTKSEGMSFVLDQQTLADSKVRQLQADLSAMQAERISKQSRWELAKSSSIDALPEILDDGRMKELRGRLTDLRRERAQLTSTLTPAHYRVLRVDAQIIELERTLQVEKSNLVQRIQNDYEASLRREKMTSESYYAQTRALAGKAGKAAEYSLLKRDAEMARQVYNTLLQQANQASIVAALPTTTIRVVEEARPAGIPVRPKPSRDIPLGTLSGLATAIGLVYLMERRKAARLATVYSEPGHLFDSLHVPELGAIPSLDVAIPSQTISTKLFAKHKTVLALPGSASEQEQAKELVTWKQRTSWLADSFRYTLTSLLGGSSVPQLIVVTSPGPAEGKTTFSTNLAAASTATGRRTLLIDGDVRRARLHTLFDTSLYPGLTELLTADKLLPDVRNSPHLRLTGIPDLYLLPAGALQVGESPAEILFSARLRPLLEELKREFDLIIVDTAPVMHFPDARLLGKVADGIVLVIRSGVTKRETAQAVAHRLHIDQVRVLGTVLNDWSPDEASTQQYDAYYPPDPVG